MVDGWNPPQLWPSIGPLYKVLVSGSHPAHCRNLCDDGRRHVCWWLHAAGHGILTSQSCMFRNVRVIRSIVFLRALSLALSLSRSLALSLSLSLSPPIKQLEVYGLGTPRLGGMECSCSGLAISDIRGYRWVESEAGLFCNKSPPLRVPTPTVAAGQLGKPGRPHTHPTPKLRLVFNST